MLEFIVGRAGTGKTEACLTAMREKMEQEPAGPVLILLLPEHMTYKVERRLASSMQKNGAGFVRSLVFGFRRFARQVLLETGGAVYPRITDIGKRLLLRKILDTRQPALSVFSRAARQRGFTESLAASIEEFKSYGVRASVLGKTAEKLSDMHLRNKLSELALLYGDFAASMKGRYNDAEDMLDTLTERLPEAAMLAGAEIWIDGFVFFNPQEKKILRVLLQKAAHVHVTLSLDLKHARENEAETGLFRRSSLTLHELKDMADELGVDCRVRSLDRKFRFREAALSTVETGLFCFPAMPSAAGDGVRIVEAATRRLEVEAVAADMLRLCREQGYRWRDIGVLVREPEAYASILELILRDDGIPFFSDSKQRSVHHPLAELVRSAFEVLHGWRYEPVFRCIRTDFFPVTRGQADRLENYVLQFGIRGKRWTMEEDWNYQHRKSLDDMAEEEDEKEKLYLAEINLIRRQVTIPLQHFAESVKDAANVRGLTEALYGLLVELEVPEKLERLATEAEREGRLVAAKEHRQIWDDIVELMEQLVETSGEDSMELDAYEGMLGDGLDGLQLSLIPPGLDYVTIAPFDQNSLDNVRAVYVLGANEGIMPRHVTEQGLLSDADRLHLQEAGLELPLGTVDNSFAEKYLLYKGFTQSREYLWVSYALADTEGKGLNASSIVGRLRKLLPQAEFLSIPLEILERRDSLLLAARRRSVAGLASALRGYREQGKMAPLWRDVYNWALANEEMQPLLSVILHGLFVTKGEEELPAELARRLYTKKRCLRGSVTRFESFNSCPFRYFAQYGLKLRERTEYRFQAPDLGTLLHAVLCAFGERLRQEKRPWSTVTPMECHRLCGEILKELAPRLQNEILLSTAQYQNFLQRIRLAAEKTIGRLIEFDGVSRFHPLLFEQSFGTGPGSLPPLVYELQEGMRLEIIGQIDRIDIAETEEGSLFLIMDYKTGNAYLNLWEIYYGLNLQLLTYLLVAEAGLQGMQGQPASFAGMLYCFLRNKLVATEQGLSEEKAKELLLSELRMPGWVVADAGLIEAIDTTHKFIKVSLNRDGSIRAGNSSIRSREEFDIVLSYMASLLQKTGQAILSGTALPRPYRLGSDNACTYCKYHAVCGFDPQIPGFFYETMVKQGKGDAAFAAMQEATGKEGMPCHGQKNN